MRTALLRSVTFLLLAAAVHCAAARADVLRIVASDERGVTLQVSTEAWTFSAPGLDGRVHVVGVPDAHSLADPGHALLPAYSTMLAVPPDAHPTARVLSSGATDVRTGVRLAIAHLPSFTPGENGEYQPGSTVVPALTDGPWPLEPVLLGAPNSFRGRRLVGLEVRPFQYDEASATLRATASLVVRVDFNRPAGAAALSATVSAPDPHADPVLRSTVLNFGQAEPWRVAPAGATGALFARPGAGGAAGLAFDETQPEVRVTVDSTGMWVLPYSLLVARGFPVGTPVAQVSVHRHEFVESGGTQPYTTIDVPIEVEDADGNGVFDHDDRIWVYVRTWAARSGASQYQRWWGDAEAIFATVKPAGGLRMATREGWRGSASPALLTSYPAFQHWEYNGGTLMPNVSAPTDTSVDIFPWTIQAFYYDRPDSITFTANSIDTTHTVRFAVNWVGRDDNQHNDWAAVKNKLGQVTVIADSAIWSGKAAFTRTGTTFGSALSEGVNRFVSWGRPGYGPPTGVSTLNDNVGLDWFEATYWRRFEAVHSVLAFNTAGQAGEVQVHATGFDLDSLRAYDVTDPEHPVRVHVDEAHVQRGASISLDLQDSLATGAVHSYVVVAASPAADGLIDGFGPRAPIDARFARVTRQSLGTKTAADYLVIVPEAFQAAIQPLVTLRQSLGMQVLVATAEDVYDEFNGGRHSAMALRRFAKFAYNHWNTRFMLLVGDGTLDPQNYGGLAGVDWIPVNPVPGPVRVPEGYEITVSDNLYGCITGNCDPILDNRMVIPELMIGRLPVNSVADVQAVVAKIVGYETLTGDQSWRRHLLLSSDDAFSSNAFQSFGSLGSGYCWQSDEEYFVALNAKCRSIVLRDAGLSQMNVENWNLRYYLASEPINPPSPGDTCRPDLQATRQSTHAGVTPQLMSHLNAGTLWWNFQGHANAFVLTHEDLYVNSQDYTGSDDKYLFANPNKLLLFTAFSCHANMYAYQNGAPPPVGVLGGCVGEDMVTLPSLGAVASWASSCYEVVPSDDSSHINVELARSLFASPPRDPVLWDRGSRVVLGEAIEAAYMRYLPNVSNALFERGVAVTYALLGDPATRMSIGRPQIVAWANGDSVIDGQPVRLRTVSDTLTLVADLVSTARLDSVSLYVNSGGPDTLLSASQYSLSPAFPDTAGGGVYGGRRFRLTYGTRMPAETRNFVFRTRDRDGLASMLTASFGLDVLLRSSGKPLADNDEVSPLADLTLDLLSPAPIDPQADVTLTLNGVNLAFTFHAAPGDTSGREWVLTWPRTAPYAMGAYTLVIAVRQGSGLARHFRVTTDPGQVLVENLYAFPNPFDDGTAASMRGTTFSYYLLSSDVADVLLSVYTISGKRIWASAQHGQTQGYYQVPWDGRDAEGDELGNGVYLYRLRVTTSAGKHADQFGRLVKLRRPRHVDIQTQQAP